MREIKFRGKAIDTGEWVYGTPMVNPDGDSIAMIVTAEKRISVISVIPKTVGQYTGLKVKNSVELYKNDVIKYEGINGAIDRATVFWHSGFLSWMVDDGKGKGSISLCDLSTMLTDSDDGFVCDELEVIGNIHDNPELREGK